MKNMKILFIIVFMFLFTACGNNNQIIIQKETESIMIEVGENINLNNYIYGLDENNEQIDCSFDLSSLDVNTVGSYTITCTINNEEKSSISDSIIVQVIDSIEPTILVNENHINIYPINSTIDFFRHITVEDNYDQSIQLIINSDNVDFTTPGVYDVFYTAVDSSGNETSLTLEYSLVTYDAPIMSTDIVNITSDSFDVAYSIMDSDDTFTSITINLFDDDIKMSSITKYSIDDMFSFDNLFSEREYRIEIIVIYSLTLGETELEIVSSKYTETISRTPPEFSIEVNERSRYYYSVDITHIDTQSNLLSAVVELYYEGTLIHSIPFTEDGAYTLYPALANRIYDIKVTYTYDLNNQGPPAIEETSISEWSVWNPEPLLYILDETNGMYTYKIDFMISNSYNLLNEIHAILEDSEGNEISHTIISKYAEEYTWNFDLTSENLVAVIELHYDLNDGLGPQIYEYKTEPFKPYKIEIVEITQIQYIIFEGNDLILNIEFNDPLNLLDTGTLHTSDHPIDSITHLEGDIYQVRILSDYLTVGTNTINFSNISIPLEYGGTNYLGFAGLRNYTFVVIDNI